VFFFIHSVTTQPFISTGDFGMSYDEAVQVCHSGRDSLQRSLQAGQNYYLLQPGRAAQRVQIVEDESTGDLSFDAVHDGKKSRFRVEDCSQHCIFSHCIGDVDTGLLDALEELTKEAEEARRRLTLIELDLCFRLGCTAGDGSDTWDMISACVRDGVGSAHDLAQVHSAE